MKRLRQFLGFRSEERRATRSSDVYRGGSFEINLSRIAGDGGGGGEGFRRW